MKLMRLRRTDLMRHADGLETPLMLNETRLKLTDCSYQPAMKAEAQCMLISLIMKAENGQ